MPTQFEDADLLLLCAAGIVIFMSILIFNSGRLKPALALLLFGSLMLGFFMAGLDPFLNLWDEQYHALVAKNLLSHPLKPTLYKIPILDYDYRNWTQNHIWLHKQPLFLWQIAGSLAVFGENEIAVRLPSVVLHAIGSLFIFRIGRITNGSITGFYGALFFAVAYYPLELITGRYSTDHNDLFFLFYVLGSFWAWFEYQHSKKPYWLALIGFFSGCAVLVKWLVGLLVYACWGLALLIQKNHWKFKLASFRPLLISFAVSLLVFIPWQVYILLAFPKEAAYEYSLNTAHFRTPIEGHTGDLWFHINAIKDLYGSGDAMPFILLAGVIILIRNIRDRRYRIAIISSIVIVYVFFSLAATKMTSFTLLVAPFAFLGLGALVDALLNFLPKKRKRLKKFLGPVLLSTVCFFLLNPAKIQKAHTYEAPNDNRNRSADLAQMDFIKNIKTSPGEEGFVIFDAARRFEGHIAVMFYTDHVAYPFIPNQHMVDKMKQEGYSIAIADHDSLPDFIRLDPAIVKIKY